MLMSRGNFSGASIFLSPAKTMTRFHLRQSKSARRPQVTSLLWSLSRMLLTSTSRRQCNLWETTYAGNNSSESLLKAKIQPQVTSTVLIIGRICRNLAVESLVHKSRQLRLRAAYKRSISMISSFLWPPSQLTCQWETKRRLKLFYKSIRIFCRWRLDNVRWSTTYRDHRLTRWRILPTCSSSLTLTSLSQLK